MTQIRWGGKWVQLAYIWIVSNLSAKNYQNGCKFDEVLTKTNLLSFFGTRCIFIGQCTAFYDFNQTVRKLLICQVHQSLCRLNTALVRSAWQLLNSMPSCRSVSGHCCNLALQCTGYWKWLPHLHHVRIKRCHFIFGYNSCISWSIFIILMPLATGMNTPQSHVI